MLFSVAKKERLRQLSAESTGLVGEGVGGGEVREGGGGGRGEGEERGGGEGRRRRDAVKSRSSAGQINSNQLHRTGDGIASLKIEGGRKLNVTVVSAPRRFTHGRRR